MKTKLILGLVFILVLTVGVFAEGFGVSSEYYSSRPLELHSGVETETFFLIQNNENVDLTIKVSFIEGDNVASLIEGDSYSVPAFGSKKVGIEVDIPNYAESGTRYDVRVLFESVNEGNSGDTVSFQTNIESSFPVIVVEGGEQPNYWIWVILAIIILIVIIFIILRVRK